MPTSKRGWWDWAKTTTAEYLLRHSLSKNRQSAFLGFDGCTS
ncbi:hypothetical protein [Candidatus Kuenenia stuttgartiensis]|nr:hypothetical protein [Candidatus Kuenenia stuttgartiensis]